MQTEAEISYFLSRAGWGEAAREPMGADFSTRRYARLTREEQTPRTAILMMAEPDQRTEHFVHLAFLLRRLGLPAPEIYESDEPRHMALMQDFGHEPCGKLLDAGASAAPFDAAAALLLARLHDGFEPGHLGALKVPFFNAALLTDQATLFLDHYFPSVFHRAATAMERSGFVEAWHGVLSPLDSLPRTLLLRDFMPDNAMKLAVPAMGSPIGLLDFQDAGLGCFAYDLGSWCEDVRRDGGLARLEGFLDLYHGHRPQVDRATLGRAARIYLAQRHTRILGILARTGRTALIPRVWAAVMDLLREEPLAPVRQWFAACPPPV